MKKALILFLLALLPVLIFADTDIYPGNVSGKWMLRDSPFIIHGDINIINTDSLIIDQGVEVKFAGHYQIECHGFIETNGTPSNHVTFTVTDTTGFSDYSISNGSWRGIYFDYTTSTSKFNYTTIKYTKDLGTNTRYGTLLGDGGAICLAGSDIQIRNCEFAYNYAIHYGGAIYVESSNGFLVENTSFYNNFSDANAAAIYSNSSSVQILTNRFFDNKSALKGGALAIVNSSTGNISGNLFHHNHADIGGALYFDNATCDFYNNTVANNIADTSAGGLAIDNGVSLDFINNIVYFNSLHQIQFASTPGFYTNYSDIQDASSEYWFATGCLDVDPLFLNPPNNYALNDTSLCINAGDPASDTYDSVPSHDLNGASRFNGAAIDMGAYEANGGSVSDFMANFHADKTEIYKGSDIQFYDDSSEATSWSWDFGDGSTSNEKNPLHTYMESGDFTVSLTAAGAGGNGSETKVNYITVRNGTYITDTDVSGFWGANNSPYIIATDIEIGEGQQLIIQQGSQVLFEDNYSMSVYGTLLAQGAINDSIYFAVTDTTGYSSNNHTGWSGIEFIDLANTTPPASQLSHCVLAYAKNSDNGGALYFDNTFDFVTVEHSRIVRCRANNGGAIALDNSSYPTFTDLYLIENKAENMGGAIYANNLSDFHYNIGKISRNTAMSASAIYATGNSQFELNNILISKNNAQNGATIDLSQIGDINFRNLTIADNHTGNIGYAISTINTNLAIKNSILWNPSLTREINADDENSATLYFSDIKDGWATGTNIYSIPPNFKNNVKYRLSIMNQDGSDKNPLIDAGDPASDFSQEPMPNGGRINLGAWGGTSRAEYSCSVVLDNITDNTVWNRTELYVVNRNVTVQEAATLNIEAGTVIQASGNHSIHILGRIVAQGTRGDTIRFTNNYDESGEDTPWNGIILESTNAQECILQNVVIENATNGLSIIDKAIHLSGTNIEFSLYSQIPTRGFSASGASDVNLSDCNITGFSTGVKFNNNRRDTATPTLTNTRIRNSASSSRDDDTAVDINGNVAVTIDNCTIEDYSTGISQDGQAGQTASPTITNSRIRNSTSSSRTLVTAIQLDDIANPMIDNNIIEGYTNAIKIVTTRRDESTPTIQNTRLRNSPSSSRNNTTCGIYLNGNVIADMINNEIDDFDTGIKYIGTGTATRDTPTLTNNRIRNSTSSSRDSLLATGIELSNVINITVDADSVLDYPVGIDISNTSRGTSTPTLTNTRVRNSTSSSRDISYGIKIIGSVAASVTNLDIDYYDYGVHYIGTGGNLRTTPTLTNTRIRNSTSSSRTAGRAGIYYEDVISSTIDGCNISEYPLAINMLNNRRDTATPTLTNSRIRTSPSSSRTLSKGIVLNGAFTGEISNNEIVNQDSAIVLYGAEANPLIKQNSIYFDEMEDDDEGAVAVYSQNSSDLLLTNNTIYLYDYALVTDSANVQLTNIISYKRNPQYEPIPESAGITVTYSDIARPNDAIYPGTGNINEDPLFYNAIQGDFSLKTDSRCIDAGDPTENDPDGSRTDIGRYFRPSLKNFDSQFTFGALPSHNVQFSQTSTGFNDTNTTWYWDVDNDGTYDVQGKNPTYQYSQAGVYSVKLKVVKNTVQDSLIKENFVVIQSNQLPAPQNLQLSVTGSDITLTWDPIQWTRRDRGRYYLIYKSDRPDANFEYLDRTNNVAEYIHTDGATLKKAFYKIIAFSGDFRSLILYIENHREVNNSTRDVKRTK